MNQAVVNHTVTERTGSGIVIMVFQYSHLKQSTGYTTLSLCDLPVRSR